MPAPPDRPPVPNAPRPTRVPVHGGWAAWRPAARAHRESLIAAIAIAGILAHLVLRWGFTVSPFGRDLPLYLVLASGGTPLVLSLALKAIRREFGSDLLAGISIVTAVLLGEYLAGALVVLMLSGGEALEQMAVGRASAVLHALASRMPALAHRKTNGQVDDVSLDAVVAGDHIVVFPHEICPVDGVVVAGHGVMDESYLTGEPFMMPKAPGSEAFSGAINGEQALTLRATRLAVDSRYARIMRVMQESEQRRPQFRRLGDQLGAWYTPIALAIAVGAWAWSGEAVRFLAVLVVATPCPLLIAIPVAIIGSISLAARHGIIIRDPAILERIDTCRTIILDKTGTLTYGEPTLTERFVAPGLEDGRVLQLAASLERYSRHPLGEPLLKAAERDGLALVNATEIGERPGEGLRGIVGGTPVRIIGRKQAVAGGFGALLPPEASGLECVVLVEDRYAATYRFHDAPREDSRSFISHLGPRHHLERILLVSGDREQEVRYLAERVGITEVHGGCSPEEKVAITRAEMARAPTLFIGDGINDAPALAAATVGIAFGNQSEITTEAAGAVVMDTSLKRVDELFHIARRMRRVALQSAVGGMAVSVAGMAVAFAGFLPPVSGAVVQEIIDLLAVLNALRTGVPGGSLTDYPIGRTDE
ncbi:MAG TPA: heavy metal translocating P-type ATPase [Vicinamibacterales bacterium]|nr:heavy metal translocating P-type ATPase [Vicinamibacterales bacterium]